MLRFLSMDRSSIPDEGGALRLGLLAVVLWSTVATAFKLGLALATPLQLLAFASLLSTLIFLIAGQVPRPAGSERPERLADGTLLKAAVLGLINPLLYYPLLLYGYDRLPAQIAQPLNYTWSLWLALLAAPLLGQRLKPATVIGLGLALVGVALLARQDPLLGTIDVFGMVLLLASAFLWALYWLLLDRLQRTVELPPAQALGASFALATPLLFAGMLWQDGWPTWSGSFLLAAVWIGAIEMGITFLLWQAALARAREAARVGALIFLSPLLALGPIHWVLGEPLRPHAVLGLALVLGGVICAQRPVASRQ